MRKLPAVLAVTALAAVALVGCSAGPASSCVRPDADSDIGSLVSVDGTVGETPEVAVSLPLQIDGTEVYDETVGDGRAVVSEAQAVVLGLTIVDGDTGDTLVQLGYDDLSQVRTVSEWVSAVPGLEDALMCATAGSRVIVGLDEASLSESAASTLGLSDGASAVAVVDLRKVYLPAAEGSLQFNDARNMPTVVRAASGQPGIIIPDADAPSETTVQVLISGDGPVPTADDTVLVNYTAVSWSTRTVTGTSWQSDPEQVSLSGTDAISQALAGVPVGSQVMIVLPADATSSGSSAQVYVIDVLGINGQAD